MRTETAWRPPTDRPTDRDIDLLSSARAEAAELNGSAGPAPAQPAEAPPAAPPGYRLIRRLGRGAQGEVWEAVQEAAGSRPERRVALKLLSQDAAPGADDGWRLRREAKLLARLAHPGIVSVFDCGQGPGGRFFVAMELVEGTPLDRFVRDRGLSVPEICRLLVKVCEAVGAAHLRGVMHRDLKPSNILVDGAGQPRVLDFGLGRLLDSDGEAMSRTAASGFIGTLAWASPEQLAGPGADVDLRTDVYALGVILYEALTGVLPHDADGPLASVASAIAQEAPALPRSLRREIPRDIETITLKCLSKDRERRYGTAGEVAADLRRALEGRPIAARRDSALYLARVMLRRHKLATGAAAACLLVGLGVGLAGGAMLVQAQQDLKVAQQDLQVAQAENRQLREDLEELKQALVAPGNWTGAFTSGDAMKELPPNEGWQVVKAAWAEVEEDGPKQQLLKMAYFAKLPYVIRVMHLGITDRSPAVQKWAMNYLRGVAFLDFAEDYPAYLRWHEEFADATLAEARRESFRRWAEDVAEASPQEFARALKRWDVPLGDEKLLGVAERVGLLERLLTLAAQPGDAGSAAGRALSGSPLGEQILRDRILPLLARDQPPDVRARAGEILGRTRASFALDALLAALVDAVRDDERRASTFATALSDLNDPRAIPTMIGVMEAREGYHTVYGIGYFGLGDLTGVRYDEAHGGAWWRKWWEENKQRYGEPVASMEIPQFSFSGPRAADQRPYAADVANDVDSLTKALINAVREGRSEREIYSIGNRLGELNDPDVIPLMIGMMAAREELAGGLGNCLNELTGVRYDESHDGAWWRSWWEKNRQRYGEPYASMEVPTIELPQPEAPAPGEIEPGVQRLHAGGDEQKVYILNQPAAGAEAEAPDGGWKLLLVLPGGDGSADFQPFVTRIARQALPEGWLLAQLVAPQWSADQKESVVWPIEKSPWPQMKFSTEAFIKAVVEDVKQRHTIADDGVFAMGWSSGGPPVYAAALADQTPVRGAFVVMSIFYPQMLPPLENGKGKPFYILHSPQDDLIEMRLPEAARDQLAAAGAETKLATYEGGHGWRGNVYGMIRRGLEWLQEHAGRE